MYLIKFSYEQYQRSTYGKKFSITCWCSWFFEKNYSL